VWPAARARRRLVYSRKKAAHRARRMAGQGLGPLAAGAPKAPDIKPPRAPRDRDWGARRGSPSYDSYRYGLGFHRSLIRVSVCPLPKRSQRLKLGRGTCYMISCRQQAPKLAVGMRSAAAPAVVHARGWLNALGFDPLRLSIQDDREHSACLITSVVPRPAPHPRCAARAVVTLVIIVF